MGHRGRWGAGGGVGLDRTHADKRQAVHTLTGNEVAGKRKGNTGSEGWLEMMLAMCAALGGDLRLVAVELPALLPLFIGPPRTHLRLDL